MSVETTARRPPSTPPTAAGAPWGEVVLSWPFEKVAVALEVVTTRELTTLEWVLERIVDEFSGAPPTLHEAAEELGLADAIFLRETLRQLVELQAIERREEEEDSTDHELDLSRVQFTQSGRELFRLGKIEGVPERPRLALVFDILTGEHVPLAPKAEIATSPSLSAGCRLVTPEELPEPTAHLSLDRVRAYSQERKERYHQGDSRIRRAEVVTSEASSFWASLRVNLTIDPQGAVVLRGDLRPRQLAWLQEHASTIVERASLQDLIAVEPDAGYPLADQRWLADRTGLTSQDDLPKVFTELMAQAIREVIVHGCWQSRFDIRSHFSQLANRGVHCVLRDGSTPTFAHWRELDTQPPGFSLLMGGHDVDSVPVAVVVDGKQALLAEPVFVKVSAKERRLVVMGTRVSGDRALQLRKELMAGTADELAAWAIKYRDEHAQLAALFLGASAQFAERLVLVGVPEGPTLDRVSYYKRLGSWFRGRSESTNFDWTSAARTALGEYFDNVADFAGEELKLVMEQADGLLPAERLLERLLEHVVPVSALSDPRPLESIEAVQTALRTRPAFAMAGALPAFRQVLEKCLELPTEPRQATPELVEYIVRLAGDERARRWAARYSGLWGKPTDVVTLERWLHAHAPVRRLVGSDFGRLATSFLQRAVAANRVTLESEFAGRLLAAWAACSLPTGEITGLLRKSGTRDDSGTATAGGSKKKKGKNNGGKR